jgi:hypothetical protein
MHGMKENQEISVMGRLLSLEVLVFLMGVVSLVYGLVTAGVPEIIIGGLILLSVVFLAAWLRRIQMKQRGIKEDGNE